MSKFTSEKIRRRPGTGSLWFVLFAAAICWCAIVIYNSAETSEYNYFFNLDASIRTQAQTAQNNRQVVASFEKSNPDGTKDNFWVRRTRLKLEADARVAVSLCLWSVNQYNNSIKSFLAHENTGKRLLDGFSVDVCWDASKLPPQQNS
ncbi:MAG: hypothetical protein P4L53_23615 [Candidatus Obscuribacterales bacterium]|nr:hypothetical protein [Candidatus Obscuribacterales bacterium]